MVTADQLLAHVVGDYLLQSDWMAREKTRRSVPAIAHAMLYTVPFLSLGPTPLACLTIAGTHFVIDRWRLARYVCWAGGWFGPPPHRAWSECRATGFPPEREPWMSAWLLIIADNTLHVLINAWALAA
jgi:Protein of unknown function (DUF3307)